MKTLRVLFAASLCVCATLSSAQGAGMVALADMPRAKVTAKLISERCSGFYRAMKKRGLETDVQAGVLDLVVLSGQRAEDYALNLNDSVEDVAVLAQISKYETAYLEAFRAADTQINMINSPDRLFVSDRASCFDGFGP